MRSRPRRTFALFVVMLLSTPAFPQAERVRTPAAVPTVTVSVTAAGVRFVAHGAVSRMRVEVLGADGTPIGAPAFKPGSVFDWAPGAGGAGPLADGDYQLAVTVVDAAGRLSLKQCSVAVRGGEASLLLGEAEPAGAAEPEKALPAPTEPAQAAMTFTAHDGAAGQLVTTAGDLSFRGGDFFTGRDRELMRLSADGSLTVEGALLARGGIRFSDGTVLTSAAGAGRSGKGAKASASAAGGDGGGVTPSATAGRLAKFSDAGGTLADSVVAESGGFLGVGTASPASLLHLSGPGGVSAITLNTPGPHRFRFQTVPAIPNWGALTLNANYSAGWHLDDTATNGWFFKLDTRGGNSAGELNGLWLYRVPPGANPHVNDEYPVFGVSNGRAFFRESVGIGLSPSAVPQARLDVNGGARFTPGGSGGAIQFGVPGGTETGMTISNASTRTDLRFNGTSLQLVAGPAGGPPSIINGVTVNTLGNVGIGTSNPPTAKLHVLTANTMPAIWAESPNRGVYGVSTGGSYGVYGESTGGGIGVQGVSTTNIGVGGISNSHVAISGTSTSSIGVRGQTASTSVASPGVQGTSTGAGGVGVRGDGATGVYGVSASGVGVTGESAAGYAVYANGNAGQARDRGGFVKAMLVVEANGDISRCYNSQRADGGAGSPPSGNIGCGFLVTPDFSAGGAAYTINFGFRVSDRFAIATGAFSGTYAAYVNAGYISTNEINVQPIVSDGGSVPASFTVIVF